MPLCYRASPRAMGRWFSLHLAEEMKDASQLFVPLADYDQGEADWSAAAEGYIFCEYVRPRGCHLEAVDVGWLCLSPFCRPNSLDQRSLRYLPNASREGFLPSLALRQFSTHRFTMAPSSSHLIGCDSCCALARLSNTSAWSNDISTLGTGPIYTEGAQFSSQTTSAFRNVVLAEDVSLLLPPVVVCVKLFHAMRMALKNTVLDTPIHARSRRERSNPGCNSTTPPLRKKMARALEVRSSVSRMRSLTSPRWGRY
jgi:hypothetical protein